MIERVSVFVYNVDVNVPLRSQTRLVRLLGLLSFRLLFSGTWRDPALSKEVLPPELLESRVSYSCNRKCLYMCSEERLCARTSGQG